MNRLRAIETEYKGYRFRSRLEARWAVFFDACGVKWEYEPEGYDLGNAIYYLPDFLLHGVTIDHASYERNCDIYVEVKGEMNDRDAEKINKFFSAGYSEENDWGVSRSPVLVVGSIPDGGTAEEIIDSMRDAAYDDYRGWPNYYNFETVDGDYFEHIRASTGTVLSACSEMTAVTCAGWTGGRRREPTVRQGRQDSSLAKCPDGGCADEIDDLQCGCDGGAGQLHLSAQA